MTVFLGQIRRYMHSHKNKFPLKSGKQSIRQEDKDIVSVTAIEEPLTAYLPITQITGVINYIKRSIELLGMAGVKLFNKIENDSDFISVIRDGIPKATLDNLIPVTGLTTGELSGIIRVSDRTLRRYSSQQKLNPEQSERIIEIAKLYSRGEEVFENLQSFREWMNNPVLALGNKKPKEFLDTSLGIEMLMTELGRIEHGIFA